MKERPILFNGEMVRAVLDGRKTQTRRVVKRIADIGPVTEFQRSNTTGYDWTFRNKRLLWNDLKHSYLMDRCPYGVQGDRLWVRETWGVHCNHNDIRPVDLPDMAKDYFGVAYRERDGADATWVNRWRPSIHMPRWASRITLEITGVRVERVQDISDADARSEGCIYSADTSKPNHGNGYRRQFWTLWDSINAKRGYSWESNPYVWVVEFRRL